VNPCLALIALAVFTILALAAVALLASFITEIREERARRREVAQVRAEMYEAERNVHRIVQQAHAEMLRLLQARTAGHDEAERRHRSTTVFQYGTPR
jgi:predicted exporter